jgi:hypothetical protein
VKPFFISVIILLLFNCGYAQKKIAPDYSYIITTKKVILKYQDNQPDSLLIPIVSDKYPELKKALCDTNLFFGDRLDSIIHRYKTNGTGITFFNYAVTFVNKDVISIELYYETMGAYPDHSQQWLTLNIHTGAIYTINNEINPAGLDWVYTTYKKLLKKRIADNENELDKEKVDSSYVDIYKDLNASADDLTPEQVLKNYVFTDKGIFFTTEVTLPHAAENFEPQKDWFIPYDKLKPYKLPGAMVLK